MSAFKDWLNGLTSKSTPVDADELYIRDSSGTPGSKKLTWGNLKATLLAYFDTAYLKLTGGTLAGGTVTASAPVLTTTQTWNNAAVAFEGKVTNITNTASSANSMMETWKVNDTFKVGVRKSGSMAWTGYAGSFQELAGASGLNGLVWSLYDNPCGLLGNGVGLSYADAIKWGGDYGPPTSGWDLFLYKDAANTLAQRNGTNAQTYRNYGTYTDASNYRRVALAMTTAGVATLAPEGAGTGASGNVLHISGLPTSNPGAGILWNDTGTVKVGT